MENTPDLLKKINNHKLKILLSTLFTLVIIIGRNYKKNQQIIHLENGKRLDSITEYIKDYNSILKKYRIFPSLNRVSGEEIFSNIEYEKNIYDNSLSIIYFLPKDHQLNENEPIKFASTMADLFCLKFRQTWTTQNPPKFVFELFHSKSKKLRFGISKDECLVLKDDPSYIQSMIVSENNISHPEWK